MSVQNIECQIAQAQISRLLANEPLGQAIMADLESHVAACPDCQGYIIGRNRSLDVVVGGAEPAAKPKKAAKRKDIEEDLQKVDEERQAFEKLFSPKAPKAAVEAKRESTTTSSFWKPLAYSGALAAVLFGMSFVMKNPTAIFGNRAIQSVSTEAKASDNNPSKDVGAAETTPPSAAQTEPSTEPEQMLSVKYLADDAKAEPISRDGNNGEEAAAIADPAQPGAYVMAPHPSATAAATPAPSSVDQPKPSAKPKAQLRPKVIVKQIRPVRRKRPSSVRRQKPSNSVKFYDSEGRPL